MPATKTTVEINGFVVRELRIRDGLSVQALAAQIGVQRPYIAKIELGHSTRVSPKVFNALLSAFSITDRRVLLSNPHGANELEATG
ncbi:helix-turn-helix domain-containing protein [Nocardioides sp. URHA0032]|uniref:helix-turn-helix domain-containing protein n=1 Tax=Nocardioides sp. URHA0032 TaxID=1380388 RepID=UPI0004917005|nr:helix-turn-helix transcriptional regulator [Nocardioides sp. URHA0032]